MHAMQKYRIQRFKKCIFSAFGPILWFKRSFMIPPIGGFSVQHLAGVAMGNKVSAAPNALSAAARLHAYFRPVFFRLPLDRLGGSVIKRCVTR